MIRYFTDGAVWGNGLKGSAGAYGFLIVSDSGKMLSGGREYYAVGLTNNAAELRGVLSAVNHYQSNYSGEPAEIWTDSKYVQTNVSQWASRSKHELRDKINGPLWADLIASAKSCPNIRIQWLKGHAGNTYNEIIDARVNGLIRRTLQTKALILAGKLCRIN